MTEYIIDEWKIDSSQRDTISIICPYCKHKIDGYRKFRDVIVNQVIECSNCSKKYKVETYTETYYYTEGLTEYYEEINDLMQKLTAEMISDLIEISRLKKLSSTSDIAKAKMYKIMFKYVAPLYEKKLKSNDIYSCK